MLNPTHLRTLREIASRGSIAAAADALWLTPSAVSQQMSSLEREVGQRLLERTPRSVRLTQAGVRLVSHAERILADCEAAVSDLEALANGVVGDVRVSAFPSAAQAILVPALAALRIQHPDLAVLANDLEPHEAMPALKVGDLDVVLSHEYTTMPSYSDPGLERIDVLVEPMYAALPANHALAGAPVLLSDLSHEHWIVGRDATFCRDCVIRAANTAGFEPHIEFETNDFRVLASAVAAGLGVALLPAIADIEGLAGIALQPLAGSPIERRIFIAIRKGSRTAPLVSAVVDAIEDAAVDLAARLAP